MRFWFLCCLLICTTSVIANDLTPNDVASADVTSNDVASDIVVSNAVVRLLPPGSPNTAVYFDIANNTSQTIELTRAEGQFADSFEFHLMSMDGETMRMQHLDSLSVAAHQTMALVPGGIHLMALQLKESLHEGQVLSLILYTEQGTAIPVKAIVAKP
jgi:periplasmic copper chaperone A